MIKEIYIANRYYILERLAELQTDLKDLSDKELIKHRNSLLDTVNTCIEATTMWLRALEYDKRRRKIPMKQLKKLTRSHKEALTKEGLDPRKYGLVEEDSSSFTVATKKEDRSGYRDTRTFSK